MAGEAAEVDVTGIKKLRRLSWGAGQLDLAGQCMSWGASRGSFGGGAPELAYQSKSGRCIRGKI